MRSIIFALLLTALGAAGAFAGDADQAKSAIATARSELQGGRTEAAEASLSRAEKALEGLDDATRVPIEHEIAEARRRIDDARAMFERDRLLSRIQRHLRTARESVGSDAAGSGQHGLDEAAKLIESPEARRLLDDAARTQLASEVAEVRALHAAETDRRARELIEKRMQELERVVSGDLQEYPDATARRFEPLESALAQSKSDWAPPLRERLARDKEAFQARLAKTERDRTVGAAVKYWEEALAPRVAAAHEKPEGAWRAAEDWLGDEHIVKPALARYPDDALLKAVAVEAEATRRTTSEEIGRRALAVLARAAASRGEERVRDEVAGLKDALSRAGAGSPEHAEALKKAGDLLAKWKAARESTVATRDDLEKRLTVAANVAWPDLVKRYVEDGDIVKLDPLAAANQPEAWIGKLVHLENAPNRAGWEFDAGNFDFITPVNGVPVAACYDAAIDDAIERIEAETGIEFDAGDPQDIVAVIDGAGLVVGQEFVQLTQRWHETTRIKAPVLTIVAVRNGPYALAAGYGSNLDRVPGAPKVTIAEPAAFRDGGAHPGRLGRGRRLGALGWLASILTIACGALLVARPAVLPAVGPNYGLVGVGAFVFAALWLLAKGILGDLLPALALMAAATLIALEHRYGRDLIRKDVARRWKAFALPVGSAAVALGIVHVFAARTIFL